MKKMKWTLFAGVGIAVAFAACKKGDTGATGATGPAGPSYTGVIAGHVMLYDQYGTKVDEGLSGIQVVGKSPLTTATTDVNGYYIFTGVATGDYTFTVTDPNTTPYTFGSNVATNFQYLADTLTKDIKLSAVAAFAPSTLEASMTPTSGNDSLVFTIVPDTRARDVIVFVNNSSSVSSTPGNYLISYVKAVPANATVFTLLVPASDLHDQGINTGNTAYYIAYGYPVSDYSTYEDLATGQTVYNSLSATSVTASATAP